MTPERWQRVQEVFLAAAALPPAERAALLADQCGSDAALRVRVERMLAMDEGPASLLDGVPVAPAPVSLVGQRIGPYRVVSELGRGGMGAVYLAERVDVGKRVALKMVRGGPAAPDNIERFLLERRVLSRLEHPHIAQLFDAGVSDDGTPYFAMEYVRGQPIDRYCDTQRLSIDARLALFEMICAATALAHAGGIVHRDLKAGNILVTEPGTLESGGQVKLLDFGIAKVLEEGWGHEALTHSDLRPMTPEYAAPEQLDGGAITPATDVYALGILLYRLLCGHAVHPARRRSPQGVHERAPDAGPPPPSVMAGRATTGGAVRLTPEAIAHARSTTPERLCAELGGTLDRITGTSLAPDAADRYPSAAGLLEDVRRYRARLEVRASTRPWHRGRRPARMAAEAALLGLLLLAVAGVQAWVMWPVREPGAGTIAVLPFTYSGTGEHRYLGKGIVSLLGTSFNGVDGLRAVEPRALLGLWNSASASSGNGLARRSGATVYVTGEVADVDGRLRISAILRDTANRVLARAPVEGSADSLFALVDGVAARLLVGILGAGDALLTQSAARSTRSLPALKSYLLGESELRAGRYAAAVDAFERATTEDPDFALAHYRLSTTSTWTGRSVLARSSAERAVQLSPRLGQLDSHRMVGWLHYLAGEPAEAVHYFRTITMSRPDDIDAWFQLGEAQYHWMPSLGYPAAAARQAFERVVAFEPQNGGALIHLARIAAIERNGASLDTLAERLLILEPDGIRALEVTVLRAFTGEDSAGRRRVAEQLEAGDPATLQAVGIALAATGTDPAGAAELARGLARLGTHPLQRRVGHLLAAQSLSASGRFIEAGAELASLRTLAPQQAAEARAALALAPFAEPTREELVATRDELARVREVDAESALPISDFRVQPFPPARLYLLAMLSRRLGDEAGALEYEERLGRWQGNPEHHGYSTAYTALIRASVLSSSGRPEDALRALGTPRARPDATLPDLMRHPKAHERWLRAELHRELGDDAEALRWYASFPDPTGYDIAYLAASHLRRAEVHDRRGERTEAAAHYRRFLELWSDADARLEPRVRRAREQLQRTRSSALPS